MDMMSIRRRLMFTAGSQPQPTNLIDPTQMTDGCVWWRGNAVSGYPYNSVTPKIPVTPGGTYYLNRKSDKGDGTGLQQVVCYFNSLQGYITQDTWQDNGVTKVIPSDTYYVGITVGISYKNDAVFTAV